MTPEENARQEIDNLLLQAGWIIQDRDSFDRTAGLGVAVREFLMADGTEADYLLFVDGKACGVIEAKKAGKTLSGVENQSHGYACHLPDYVKNWQQPLPFVYESTDNETFFCDGRDKNCRSRRIFAFHSPQSLLAMLKDSETLRNRLKQMPVLEKGSLRDCQFEAIQGLEASLAQNRQKSLIQMATGAGKTFTACNFSYRLLKYAQAKRILFVVDRNNLGKQTKKEFEAFRLPDENRLFPEVYIAQHLQHNQIDKDAKVVITTIQRLYSMLRGETDYDEKDEEVSAYEIGSLGAPKEIVYNSQLPPDFFDFIITDECHRSIYGDWRQVLEYFDAFIIGLTATPSKQTFGYFNKNVVAEYPYERSLADGVNVDYQILRIKTEIGENGGKIDKKFPVPVRDKKSRKLSYEQLDEDLEYSKNDLDRSVMAPNQIRTIMECYRDALYTELFPEREANFAWTPKTLIFAKDDNHAEEIVRITREVFGQGNEFCKKITYNVSGEKPEELIKQFRISPMPRIAVTVDMIATGTDIKPLEVVMFLRDVRSSLYYEQMKGRGVRSINDTDLKQVTPNAESKGFFYLIDAVGVTESKKTASQPLERKRSVSLKKMLEQISQGKTDDDTLSSVASRMVNIERRLNADDLKQIKTLSNGKTLHEMANDILDAIDFDKQAGKTAEEIEEIKEQSVALINKPAFRNALLNFSAKSGIYIDELSADKVISVDLNKEKASKLVSSFKEFIEQNKNEIDALSIIYGKQYKNRHLTYSAIQDLAEKMRLAQPPLAPVEIWRAFEVLQKDKVQHITNPARILTNLVQLVRFAIGIDENLESFDKAANQRFNLWKGRQLKKGVTFTKEQNEWLERIKDYIISNAYMNKSDIQENLDDKGGIFRAKAVFGNELDAILDDLNLTLVA